MSGGFFFGLVQGIVAPDRCHVRRNAVNKLRVHASHKDAIERTLEGY